MERTDDRQRFRPPHSRVLRSLLSCYGVSREPLLVPVYGIRWVECTPVGFYQVVSADHHSSPTRCPRSRVLGTEEVNFGRRLHNGHANVLSLRQVEQGRSSFSSSLSQSSRVLQVPHGVPDSLVGEEPWPKEPLNTSNAPRPLGCEGSLVRIQSPAPWACAPVAGACEGGPSSLPVSPPFRWAPRAARSPPGRRRLRGRCLAPRSRGPDTPGATGPGG